MANVVLDFVAARSDTSKPEMGALRYEKDRRYTLDLERHGAFARQAVADGVAVVTEADDPADMAALLALAPGGAPKPRPAASPPPAVDDAPKS